MATTKSSADLAKIKSLVDASPTKANIDLYTKMGGTYVPNTSSGSQSAVQTYASPKVPTADYARIQSLVQSNPTQANLDLLSNLSGTSTVPTQTTYYNEGWQQVSPTVKTKKVSTTSPIRPNGTQTSQTTQPQTNTPTTPEATQTNTPTSNTTQTQEKPFSTPERTSQLLRDNQFKPEDLQATLNSTNNTLIQGTNDFNLKMDSLLSNNKGNYINTIDETNNAFKRIDSLYESGISDIKQTSDLLNNLYKENRDINLEKAQLGYDYTQKQSEDAQEKIRQDYLSSIEGQRELIKQQRVRDETFNGLRGSFGSSSQLENLDLAEKQGKMILDSLTNASIASEGEYQNKLKNMNDTYLNSIRSITNDTDIKMGELLQSSNSQLREIQTNRAMSEKDRILEINNVVKEYNDYQNAVAKSQAESLLALNKDLASNLIKFKEMEMTGLQNNISNALQGIGIDQQQQQIDADIANAERNYQLALDNFNANREDAQAQQDVENAKLELQAIQLDNEIAQAERNYQLSLDEYNMNKTDKEAQRKFQDAELKLKEVQNKIDTYNAETSRINSETSRLNAETAQKEAENALSPLATKQEMDTFIAKEKVKKENELELIEKRAAVEKSKTNGEYSDKYLKSIAEKPSLLTSSTKTEYMKIMKALSDAGYDIKAFGNDTFKSLKPNEYDAIFKAFGLTRNLQDAKKLKDIVSTGLGTSWTYSLGQKSGLGTADAARDLLRNITGKEMTLYMKEMSGVAISPEEAERLQNDYPIDTQTDSKFNTNINMWISKIENGLNQFAGQYGFDSVEELQKSVGFSDDMFKSGLETVDIPGLSPTQQTQTTPNSQYSFGIGDKVSLNDPNIFYK